MPSTLRLRGYLIILAFLAKALLVAPALRRPANALHPLAVLLRLPVVCHHLAIVLRHHAVVLRGAINVLLHRENVLLLRANVLEAAPLIQALLTLQVLLVAPLGPTLTGLPVSMPCVF